MPALRLIGLMVMLGARASASVDQGPQSPVAALNLFAAKQVILDGKIFFFDADFDGLSIVRSQETQLIHSNVLVYAFPPTATSAGVVRAVPDFTAWFDPRGYVHTIDVLKRQMAFDHFVLKQGTQRCPDGRCRLSAGRDTPIEVSVVPVTGIMDPDTFMIPVREQQIRLDRLLERMWSEAARDPTNTQPLKYWHDELNTILAMVDDYEKSLTLVAARFHAASPLATFPPHWKAVTKGDDHLGGFQGLGDPDFPMLDPDHPFPVLYGFRYVTPGGSEPEAGVTKALNPAADPIWQDAQVLGMLKTSERQIDERLKKAEEDGDLLFGGADEDRP